MYEYLKLSYIQTFDWNIWSWFKFTFTLILPTPRVLNWMIESQSPCRQFWIHTVISNKLIHSFIYLFDKVLLHNTVYPPVSCKIFSLVFFLAISFLDPIPPLTKLYCKMWWIWPWQDAVLIFPFWISSIHIGLVWISIHPIPTFHSTTERKCGMWLKADDELV